MRSFSALFLVFENAFLYRVAATLYWKLLNASSAAAILLLWPETSGMEMAINKEISSVVLIIFIGILSFFLIGQSSGQY